MVGRMCHGTSSVYNDNLTTLPNSHWWDKAAVRGPVTSGPVQCDQFLSSFVVDFERLYGPWEPINMTLTSWFNIQAPRYKAYMLQQHIQTSKWSNPSVSNSVVCVAIAILWVICKWELMLSNIVEYVCELWALELSFYWDYKVGKSLLVVESLVETPSYHWLYWMGTQVWS